MSFLDKWYVGWNQYDEFNIFKTQFPTKATPEVSGYDRVEGPFDTEEEAQAVAEKE